MQLLMASTMSIALHCGQHALLDFAVICTSHKALRAGFEDVLRQQPQLVGATLNVMSNKTQLLRNQQCLWTAACISSL